MENKKLSWAMTGWQISKEGQWIGDPPWIIVEGRIPFKALHPKDYIKELERMIGDKELTPGLFYTYIGQLKDALVLKWKD